MSGEAKARGKGKGKGQFSKKGKGDRMEEEMNGIGNGEFQPFKEFASWAFTTFTIDYAVCRMLPPFKAL